MLTTKEKLSQHHKKFSQQKKNSHKKKILTTKQNKKSDWEGKVMHNKSLYLVILF